MDDPTPSLGRMVVYNHPGSADRKFSPKQSPALIQKVSDDGTVEMVVFSVYGGLFFNHSVEQGDGQGSGTGRYVPKLIARYFSQTCFYAVSSQ